MNTLLLAMPGAESLAARIAAALQCGCDTIEAHRFPDGETVVRLRGDVTGLRVILLALLHHPDDKTLPLLFAADAARDLGAAEVGLVAPYLPYMRQDERFRPGEAVTSRTFARLLSASIDFLVTVDPHLHRLPSLDAIYTARTHVVAAAPAIADWVQRHVANPVMVGPDSESEQWVADVARRMGAPFVVMSKVRRGDRDVSVRLPEGAQAQGRTPVLLDDIASSGHTLATASRVLCSAGWGEPLAIAVHALVDAPSLAMLREAGIRQFVSCDSVPHASNGIALDALLARGIRAITSPS